MPIDEAKRRRRRESKKVKRYPAVIFIRATAREKAAILANFRASAATSVSRFLVLAGTQSVPVLPFESRHLIQQALFETHKIGTNLNQLTRALNTFLVTGRGTLNHRDVDLAAQEVAKTLRTLRALIDTLGR
jgi:hypothetical protein